MILKAVKGKCFLTLHCIEELKKKTKPKVEIKKMLKMRISEGKKLLESKEGVEIKNEKTR